jgi:hypothetical protein
MARRLSKRRKSSLIHKLPKNISGKSKKSRFSPLLAGVLIGLCVYTFFSAQNAKNQRDVNNERHKMVMDYQLPLF